MLRYILPSLLKDSFLIENFQIDMSLNLYMAIRLSIIYVILSYARGEKHGINVSSQGAGGILFF